MSGLTLPGVRVSPKDPTDGCTVQPDSAGSPPPPPVGGVGASCTVQLVMMVRRAWSCTVQLTQPTRFLGPAIPAATPASYRCPCSSRSGRWGALKLHRATRFCRPPSPASVAGVGDSCTVQLLMMVRRAWSCTVQLAMVASRTSSCTVQLAGPRGSLGRPCPLATPVLRRLPAARA